MNPSNQPSIPPIIIPTQLVAKLKLQAIKEKLPSDHYLNLYRETLRQKAVEANIQPPTTSLDLQPEFVPPEEHQKRVLQTADAISLNEEQQEAVRLALEGRSFCLIGPAGTGKTSTVNRIITTLRDSGRISAIGETTRVLKASDLSMVGCAYTRRAKDNLARNSPKELPTATLHSLIEFAPKKVTKEVPNDKGELVWKESMIFEPTRNKDNPLPVNLQLIIIDEASMVSTELWNQVMDAIHPLSKIQFIFLGDLAQLPPVFGHAILGFKLLEIPVVELKKVYRQKDGEILDFATQVRQGITYKPSEFSKPWCNNERLHIYTSKQVESEERRTYLAGHKIQELIHTGQVNPEAGDFILCPYNKGFGNLELNKWAADYYDQRDGRKLYTILAGFQKRFFAVGDKVLVDKKDAVILAIDINPRYTGPIPPLPSNSINRWGVARHGKYMKAENILDVPSVLGEDDFNNHMSNFEDAIENQEQGQNAASHIVTYQMIDDQTTGKLQSTGEINQLELSYCISVHKSQGSQADVVVLFISRLHRRLQCREILYTAATRAINKLLIFADPDSINKCIRTPIIKGDTIQEKAEYFKGVAREKQKKEGEQGEIEFEDIEFT